MSYATEVKVYDDPKFYATFVRLATREEAEAYGKNKVYKWPMADTYQVVESTEPVNYRWDPEVGLVGLEEGGE